LLVVLLLAPRAAAQSELRFSPVSDPKGAEGTLRELRLRPHVHTEMFLHIHKPADAPAAAYKAVLYAGKDPVASADVKADKAITAVKFGVAPPPKDGKPAPLPLAETDGPLSIRLLDEKGDKVDEVEIGVAAPKEYVKPGQPSFTLAPASEEKENGDKGNGPRGVLEVTLSALPTFHGSTPARVELVLDPERLPYLVPGQKKQGSYAGVLLPGQPLVLRAENLQLKAGKQDKGLFYVTVDGYARAFSWVSSVSGTNTPSTPQAITGSVVRLQHPSFVKPGDKLPVTVEVDNMPKNAYCSLGLFRTLVKDEKGQLKAVAGRDGLPHDLAGDRVKLILFSPKGPAGALVFESKVRDHSGVFDTKDLFGMRYLALQMIDKGLEAKAKAKAKKGEKVNPFLQMLDSKNIPALGLTKGFTRLIVEPVLLHEGGPELVLKVNLPLPPKGELPELSIGAPLPLKALTNDPTGVVKAMFFLGKPLPDGKLPPGAIEGDPVPGDPTVWTALLQAPTEKALLLTVGVQVTNGVGEKATKIIKIQLVDPKAPGPAAAAKLATITGKVTEGDRPQAGVPVTLSDDQGKLKGATKTDKTGNYKFEKVAPGAYLVVAARSASKTRGQALVSVPPEVPLVPNVDIALLRQGRP
jgi:hypothetical protein